MNKHAIVLVLALAPLVSAQAETVVIPVGQQAAEKQSLERPRRGATTQQVAARFGEPQQRRGPVGDPPITAWEYPQYTVYFEYDKVLHTVLKREVAAD